jgi:hypothetical protein
MQGDLAADTLGQCGIKRLISRARIDQRAMVHGGRGGRGEAQRIHNDQDIATFGGVMRAAPSPGQPDARDFSALIVIHERTPFWHCKHGAQRLRLGGRMIH